MSASATRIQPLTRVTATLTVHREQETTPAPPIRRIAFVYGIGPGGLSPFETALADTAARRTVRIDIPKDSFAPVFGHLVPLLGPLVQTPTPCRLDIQVEAIEPADPREVIRAMAEHGGCGSGCDCGCGC